MKILCIIPSLTSGGAERVMSILASEWAKEHDVHLLTIYSEKSDFYPTSPNITRYSLDSGKRSKWQLFLQIAIISRIRKLFKVIQPDHVVSFLIKANIYTALALLRRKSSAILCEHHIIRHPKYPIFLNLLRSFIYPLGYKIGVLTESIKKELLFCYPRISEDNVIVLPNPVYPIKKFGIDEIDRLRMRYSVHKRDIFVLGVGRLVKEKYFSYFIEIVDRLLQSGIRIKAVILGDGPKSKSLQARINGMNLDNHIFMPGVVQNIEEYYRSADFLLSTASIEGFPMTVCEALMSELPVIAFDAPGVRDLISHNKSGMLAPFGDIDMILKMFLHCLNDPSHVAKLVKNGYEYIIQFNLGNINDIWFSKVFV